jgi:hypothetical protein
MPIGLQLYTVGKEMEEDPRGTLKRVAAVGYKEVRVVTPVETKSE